MPVFHRVGKSMRRRMNKYRRKSLASKVATLSKQVRMRKPEVKWAEYAVTSGTYNYAGSLSLPLQSITQGTADFGQRIGDEITMLSMKFKFSFQMYSTTGGQTNRIIVFQVKNNPDGAIGSASYVNLVLHSADLSTARATLAPVDYDNRASYRILYDKTFTTNYSSSPGTSASNNVQSTYKQFTLNIPKTASRIQYYNAGTTLTEGEICVIVLSDLSSLAGYNYTCLMKYYDA